MTFCSRIVRQLEVGAGCFLAWIGLAMCMESHWAKRTHIGEFGTGGDALYERKVFLVHCVPINTMHAWIIKEITIVFAQPQLFQLLLFVSRLKCCLGKCGLGFRSVTQSKALYGFF